MLINVFLLCIALGIATADYACFPKVEGECLQKWANEHSTADFCDNQIAMAKCKVKAAKDCKTGLEDDATVAHWILAEACTEGTSSYKAMRRNNSCGIKVLSPNSGCYENFKKDLTKFDESPDFLQIASTTCRHIDDITNCLYKKAESCDLEAKLAVRSIVRSDKNIYDKVCAAFPSS